MTTTARAAPARTDHLLVIAALLGLTVLAWAVSDARMGDMGAMGEEMGAMDGGPLALGGLGVFLVTWVVMMAAMMFPSVAPMVAVHARVRRAGARRHGHSAAGTTAAFVAGYLVAWTVFGLLSYGVVALGGVVLDGLTWAGAGHWLAGGVIVGAAVFERTAAKDACLTRCRGPLAFLLDEWRDGRRGAWLMGTLHGGWCVGCCWALMAALFALGIMSLGWMAFVAALIAAEKLLPWRAATVSGVTAVLLVLGVAVAVSPDAVPGLAPA